MAWMVVGAWGWRSRCCTVSGKDHQYREGRLGLARHRFLDDHAGMHTCVCAQGAACVLAAEPQQLKLLSSLGW